MNNAQRATLLIGWIVLLAVNASDVFPRVYKGRHHVVGTETVSVYVPDSDPSRVTVPITNPSASFSETGQRVAVYVRNGYRDDEIQRTPRVTALLLLGFVLVYAIVTRITTKRRPEMDPS
jgi:hypothetical protein